MSVHVDGFHPVHRPSHLLTLSYFYCGSCVRGQLLMNPVPRAPSVWSHWNLPKSPAYNGSPQYSVSHIRCIYCSLSSSTPSSVLRSGHAAQTVARSSSIGDLFDVDVNSSQRWLMPHFPLRHAEGAWEKKSKNKKIVFMLRVSVCSWLTWRVEHCSCSITRFQASWKG